MSDYTLTIPEEVYIRARRIAEETSQPVEQVLIEHLRTLSASLPVLPPDEEAELEALKQLSDDALWTIGREHLPDDLQARIQYLMDRNSLGPITPEEYAELGSLVDRGERLMLRKSRQPPSDQTRIQVTPKDLAARE
jgi:hypothetical protein